MHSLALALSMVALEEAAVSTGDELRAGSPEPAPLDSAGRAAQAVAWRRWAAEGRDGLAAVPQPGPLGWVRLVLGGRSPAR